MQRHRADLRMVEPHRGAAALAHVVAGPQPAKQRARERQLPDERRAPGIVGVGADRLAKARHEPGRGRLPIGEEGLLGRVEEHVPEAVASRRQARGEGRRERRRGEDVQVPALHERRQRERREQGPHPLRHGLGRPPAGAPGPLRGEPEQIRGRVLVELQHAGQGPEDLRRGVAVAALLKAQVVLDADAGEHRDLGAPQAGDPAHADVRDARPRGVDEVAPGPEEIAQQVRLVGHDPIVCSGPRR